MWRLNLQARLISQTHKPDLLGGGINRMLAQPMISGKAFVSVKKSVVKK